MKKVDVLLIYEHKARELENCALIASELERRGYKTKLSYNYSAPIRFFLKPTIIIVPHAYNEEHMAFYIRNKWNSNKNVISMQYEQILAKYSEDGIHNPSGQARMAQHTAWGEAQVERYLKHDIDPSHIHDTGSVSMDLFRPEFRSYFLSREQIGKEFGLDTSKEWVLFISSFSYAKRTEKNISELARHNPNAYNIARLSDESYKAVLMWLRKAIEMYPDKLFIYRKHPAELDDRELIKIEEEHPNFRCIDTYSMRQWSLVVDKLYNWYSTSLVDVYFANKPCYILRPIPIPKHIEVSIMVNAKFIADSDEFLESLNDKEFFFPVPSDDILYYYSNRAEGKMAYQKVADLCERMIKEPQMGFDYKFDYPNGLSFYVKMLYDFFLYEYGKRFKTSESFISRLKKIPYLAKTAAKLQMYNKELYRAKQLYESYFDKFSLLLKNK